jgi:hypothetical protein
MSRLADLWHGRVPLGQAFWGYAILLGSLLNLVTTGAALASFVLGLHPLLALAIHFLSVPYNLLMVVAVWRSAARYQGEALWARLARGAVIAWAVLATLA